MNLPQNPQAAQPDATAFAVRDSRNRLEMRTFLDPEL